MDHLLPLRHDAECAGILCQRGDVYRGPHDPQDRSHITEMPLAGALLTKPKLLKDHLFG